MSLTAHLDYVESVAWSPSSAFLASAGGDGQVIVWKARTGHCVTRRGTPDSCEEQPAPVPDVVWLDDEWVAVPTLDGGWQAWQVVNRDGKEVPQGQERAGFHDNA